MTILVLEDLEDWQAKIADAIRERDHSVMQARTVWEAEMVVGAIVARVTNGAPAGVDAVFADHDMPTSDPEGFDDGDTAGVIARLRAVMPLLPIVAISAVESNNEHLLAAGADVVCVKGELLACMDEVLHRITTIQLRP